MADAYFSTNTPVRFGKVSFPYSNQHDVKGILVGGEYEIVEITPTGPDYILHCKSIEAIN